MSSSKKLFDFHWPVAIPAALFVIAFVTITLIVGEPIKTYFSHIQTILYDNIGWFFVSIVNIMLFASVVLIISPFGKIKLGGAKASKDFSDFVFMRKITEVGGRRTKAYLLYCTNTFVPRVHECSFFKRNLF